VISIRGEKLPRTGFQLQEGADPRDAAMRQRGRVAARELGRLAGSLATFCQAVNADVPRGSALAAEIASELELALAKAGAVLAAARDGEKPDEDGMVAAARLAADHIMIHRALTVFLAAVLEQGTRLSKLPQGARRSVLVLQMLGLLQRLLDRRAGEMRRSGRFFPTIVERYV
jgi:hypothetical protein